MNACRRVRVVKGMDWKPIVIACRRVRVVKGMDWKPIVIARAGSSPYDDASVVRWAVST